MGGRRIHARVRRPAPAWAARSATATGVGACCWPGSWCSALASAGAAFAGGVEELIAARAVMGAGAAFIMPATLSLLISVFEDPRERATAIGLWAATAGVGVALGPVVGGFLLDHFSWGSIFIVNLPLCAAALVVGPRVIAESLDPSAPRVDWLGAALSGIALLALVWAVIEAPSEGWTALPVLAAFAVAGALSVAFVVQQRRVAEPLLDLEFSGTRASPRRAPRSWCSSSRSSASCSCARSTSSSCSATHRSRPACGSCPMPPG